MADIHEHRCSQREAELAPLSPVHTRKTEETDYPMTTEKDWDLCSTSKQKSKSTDASENWNMSEAPFRLPPSLLREETCPPVCYQCLSKTTLISLAI